MSKTKWTALERHTAQCGTDFCTLHAAAPMMAEALRKVVKSVSCGACRHGIYDGTSSCCLARAALKAAGLED
jgi:hypothetical protein